MLRALALLLPSLFGGFLDPFPDEVLQNCRRHEWFGCSSYDLARKAAIDIVAGLPPNELSRADRIQEVTADLMQLGPGWRWVRDQRGSRREYVPLSKPLARLARAARGEA